MDNTTLQKKSKQGAYISLIGFLFVIIAFAIGISEVSELNDSIDLKKTELAQMNRALDSTESVIKENRTNIATLMAEINKLKDPNIYPKSSSTLLPGVMDPKKRQVFDFTIWLTSSQATLNKITSVRYNFNNETFLLKDRESSNRSNGFLISYRGWGCLSYIAINITYQDGQTKTLYYDMCSDLNK
jgi:hypothetical protein